MNETPSLKSSNDDIFHDVTMIEQRIWTRGYEEGQEDGKKRLYDDGFHLGVEKGIELGREVGFYSGYASQILKETQSEDSSSRTVKVCHSIVQLANQLKDIEPTDELLSDNLSKLQAKFKQLTSLLKIQVEYKDVIQSKPGASF